MKISRREFIGSAVAAAAVGTAGKAKAEGAVVRWYKGNLHMHSYWSDGKTFPEMALDWYRSRGYNFCGLSDHNVFQNDNAKWKLCSGCNAAVLAEYRANWNAETRGSGSSEEVRLKTFDEFSAALNVPGEFLVLPNVEDTRFVKYSNGTSNEMHMNFVNVPGLPPEMTNGFSATVNNCQSSLADFLRENRVMVANYAQTLNRPHLFMLNHPIWRWYEISPEVIIANPEVRFFEQCNNGGDHDAPAPGLLDDGLDTDRLWDVVNAFRARAGQPLLYGLGNDDTHYYAEADISGKKMLMPGNAWTIVRATELTAAALITALEAGDSVVCEGVQPEDVVFDRATGRLEVSVAGKPGVARTIRFIVSKRDFNATPEEEFDVGSGEYLRHIKIYDRKRVGVVAKMVQGRPGEALRASYTLKPDDLYVRARIESPGMPLCTAPLHPLMHMAWTQPYQASEA